MEAKAQAQASVSEWELLQRQLAEYQAEQEARKQALANTAKIAEAERIAKLNSEIKEWKFKINELKGQLIEIDFLKSKAKDIANIYSNRQFTETGYFVDGRWFIKLNNDYYNYLVDTDFKLQLMTELYRDAFPLKKEGTNENFVIAFMSSKSSAINLQIAQLQNELEKKQLELE